MDIEFVAVRTGNIHLKQSGIMIYQPKKKTYLDNQKFRLAPIPKRFTGLYSAFNFPVGEREG